MLPTSSPSEHTSRAQPVPSVARSRYSSAIVSLTSRREGNRLRALAGKKTALTACAYYVASRMQRRLLGRFGCPAAGSHAHAVQIGFSLTRADFSLVPLRASMLLAWAFDGLLMQPAHCIRRPL